MSTPPDGFRHTTPITVRFSDLDAMGHVNNAVYLTYLEIGRIQYYRDLGLWQPIPRLIGPIMAKATVDYKLPLNLEDDQVVIYSRCARIGGKSYDMEHQIIRYKEDRAELAAHGLIVMVAFDYRVGQSISVPDDWRAKFSAYEPLLNSINGGS
ncbi:MAG: thioesterase family protein [Chloroflexota bacterium]